VPETTPHAAPEEGADQPIAALPVLALRQGVLRDEEGELMFMMAIDLGALALTVTLDRTCAEMLRAGLDRFCGPKLEIAQEVPQRRFERRHRP
jgi:hypothetical protein